MSLRGAPTTRSNRIDSSPFLFVLSPNNEQQFPSIMNNELVSNQNQNFHSRGSMNLDCLGERRRQGEKKPLESFRTTIDATRSRPIPVFHAHGATKSVNILIYSPPRKHVWRGREGGNLDLREPLWNPSRVCRLYGIHPPPFHPSFAKERIREAVSSTRLLGLCEGSMKTLASFARNSLHRLNFYER